MIYSVSKFDRLQLSLNLAILRKDISAQQLVLLVVAGGVIQVYTCAALRSMCCIGTVVWLQSRLLDINDLGTLIR